MTAYILKMVLCSGLFLLFYFLFLQREKMHRFNRFYLLFAIATAFVIPLIPIPYFKSAVVNPVDQFINLPATNITQHTLQTTPAATQPVNYLFYCLLAGYLCITVFLLFRFIKNITALYHTIKNNNKISYNGATLVLTEGHSATHSFLQYIFIDKYAFENAAIEKEILSHELTHVKQKHSLDILLAEVLLVICWFNPFLFLYRKAIQLNHEFLADDAVVKTFNNTIAYQYLLLKKSSHTNGLQLTSQFNYLITKKRLLMLTKKTSPKIAVLKQFALIPLLAIAVFIFSTKSFAQEPPAVKIKTLPYGSGASAELLNEYDSTIKNMNYEKTLKNGQKAQVLDMSKGNPDRLAFIFGQMNKEQRDYRIKATHIEIVPNIAPAKNSPASAQLNSWKDGKKYGVWLDGKRIANSELNKYNAADFALYWESKLSKNAINYGKHFYQVDLYTAAYYDESYIQKANKYTIRRSWK